MRLGGIGRQGSLVLMLAMVLGLSACATPSLQTAQAVPVGFTGPHIEEGTLGRGAFIAHDGARLPYLRWLPADQKPWAVIIALHGFNDHKASFRMAGAWWAERGIEVWAYDQRGFGLGPNVGQFAPESLTSEDLRTVVALVKAQRPGLPIAVAGESMGGATAIAAFSSDRPPAADQVILMGPAVWGWSSQNPLNRVSLWTAAHLMGEKAVKPPEFALSRVTPSDNLAELVRMGRDPQVIDQTRFDAIYGLVDLMETASVRLGQVKVPTLLMYGAQDHLIRRGPMRLALQRAGDNPLLTTAWYPQGWHLLNRDLEAQIVYADVEAWLRDPAAPLPSRPEPVLPSIEAGKMGHSDGMQSLSH